MNQKQIFDSDGYTRVRLEQIGENDIGKKIETFGWVANVPIIIKHNTFINLYSSFKILKCFYSGEECTKIVKSITPQTTLTVRGLLVSKDPEKDGHLFELRVSEIELFQGQIAEKLPFNNCTPKGALWDIQSIYLRSDKRRFFLRARDALLKSFRRYYEDAGYIEINPPTLVQTQVEGGSTLFKLNFYGEEAYLTQSSQLYLETVVPVAGKVFAICPSYRAEKSNTPRHLCEYTHVEGEICDITFDELMDIIEEMVKAVVSHFAKLMGGCIPKLKDKKFEGTSFIRITYADAIEVLREHGVKKILNGSERLYEFGDDISDSAEKRLVEIYEGIPVFLTMFRVEDKAFYAKRCSDSKFTETVDLLLPGIGETVGGSMRCSDPKMLEAGFKLENIDMGPYKWYTDMAKFGPSPHGGYGLGFERLLMWLLDYDCVQDACLYPRVYKRCQP